MADYISAFPGRDGAVLIAAGIDGESVEIQCFSDGYFDFSYEARDQAPAPIIADLTYADVQKQLRGVGWQSPRLFASCTQNTFALSKGGTGELRFKIRLGVEYPASNAIVFRRGECMSVSTLNSFIPSESRAIHRSSGKYRQVSWPLAAA